MSTPSPLTVDVYVGLRSKQLYTSIGNATPVPLIYFVRKDSVNFRIFPVLETGQYAAPLLAVDITLWDFQMYLGLSGVPWANQLTWTKDLVNGCFTALFNLNQDILEALFSGGTPASVAGLLEFKFIQSGAPISVFANATVFNSIENSGAPDPSTYTPASVLVTNLALILQDSTDIHFSQSGETMYATLLAGGRRSGYSAASQVAMLALSGVNKGDFCIRTDLNQVFELTTAGASTLGHWTAIPKWLNPTGQWLIGTSYNVGDLAYDLGSTYISQVSANVGNDPSNPANVGSGKPWGLFAGSPGPAVVAPVTLQIGQAPVLGTSGAFMRQDAQFGLPPLADISTDGFISALEIAKLDALFFPVNGPTFFGGSPLRIENPIISGISCSATVSASKTVGQVGQMTVAQIRVRGVMEPKNYISGTREGSNFYRGGTPAAGPANIFKLTVVDASGTEVYYFNYWDYPAPGGVYALDYQVSIIINGVATITLVNDTVDAQEYPNAANLVIPGISPAPAAFNGQFVQIDCLQAYTSFSNSTAGLMTEQVISVSTTTPVNISPPLGFAVHTVKIACLDGVYDAAYTAQIPILHANANIGDIVQVHVATPLLTDVTVKIFDNTTGGALLLAFDCLKTGYSLYAEFEYNGTWSLINYDILTQDVLSNQYLRGQPAYASAQVIDLDGPAYQEITVTGAITISTTNRSSGLPFTKSVAVKLIASGGNQTFALAAGIVALGTVPANLISGKTNYLCLTSNGPLETDTVAAIASQA